VEELDVLVLGEQELQEGLGLSLDL
jgi:hypothetical protein